MIREEQGRPAEETVEATTVLPTTHEGEHK